MKTLKTPTPFSITQVKQFFKTCHVTLNAKMAVACAFAARTGSRRRAVVETRRDWIDWDNCRMVHPKNKNGKEMIYYFDKAFMSILRKWDNLLGDTEYLFPAQDGGKLTPEGFYSEYVKHLQLAGLWVLDPKRKDSLRTQHKYVFHTWRATFASLLVNNKVEIYTASKLMGHNDVAVTQQYYTKLGAKAQLEALSKVFNGQEEKIIPQQNVNLPDPKQLLDIKLVNGEITNEEYKTKIEMIGGKKE